jgi:acetoin utilization protein AcuB
MATLNAAVTDVMSRPAVSVDERTSVRTALAIVARSGVHHLPVLRMGTLSGFVCACDLRDAPSDSPVGDRMRTRVVTIGLSSTAQQAANAMTEHSVGSVLVVDGAKLVGILTREDLLKSCQDAEALFAGQRCACCGKHQHLRAGSDGHNLCIDCIDARSAGERLVSKTAG